MEYETRTTTLTVAGKGETLASETATTISITDEGAGEFIEIIQECGKIRIDRAEWSPIVAAVDQLITHCRG